MTVLLLALLVVLRAPPDRRPGARGEHAVTLLGVVEVGQIVEVIWVSLLAGVGITAVYSFAVLGTAGWAEARRARRTGAAVGYGLLAVLSLVAFAGIVVVGVQIMLSKPA